MKAPVLKTWSRAATWTVAGLALLGATGCQTNIGGQALPSGYYLHDDIQYFPAGPEDKVWRERLALKQYKDEQDAIKAGLVEPAPANGIGRPGLAPAPTPAPPVPLAPPPVIQPPAPAPGGPAPADAAPVPPAGPAVAPAAPPAPGE